MKDPQAEGAIQIRVERLTQIFNMLDPDPFGSRDLAPEAESFIVEWAEELPAGAPLSILVHLPAAQAALTEAQGLPDALAHFFAYRAATLARELKELFHTGRIALLIGLCVLALCLIIAQSVAGRIGERTFSDFVAEGLIIVGWVALWRPLEIFLYDWWPVLRRRNLYRRIAAARIEVRGSERDA